MSRRFNQLIIATTLITLVLSVGLMPASVNAQAAQATAAATAASTTPLQQKLTVKTGKVQILLADRTKVTIDTTTTPPSASILPPDAGADATPTPLILPSTTPLAIALDPTTKLPVVTVFPGQTIITNIPGGGLAELDTVIPAANGKTVVVITTIDPGTVAIIEQIGTSCSVSIALFSFFSLFVPFGSVTTEVPPTGLLTDDIEVHTPLAGFKFDAQNGAKSQAQVTTTDTDVSVNILAESGTTAIKPITGPATSITADTGGQTKGSVPSSKLAPEDITQLKAGGSAMLFTMLQKKFASTSLTADQIKTIHDEKKDPVEKSIKVQFPVLDAIYDAIVSGKITGDDDRFVKQVIVATIQCCTTAAASGVGGVTCS